MTNAEIDTAERRLRRQLVRVALFVLAAVLVVTMLLVWWWSYQREAARTEAQRAEVAVQSAESLCAQVRALGGACAVDPEALRAPTPAAAVPVPGKPGEPGTDGRDGRDGSPGATGRPGADGRDGNPGQPGVAPPPIPGPSGAAGQNGTDGRDGRDGVDGSPGPTCPDGYVQQEITVLTSEGPRPVVACVLTETEEPA